MRRFLINASISAALVFAAGCTSMPSRSATAPAEPSASLGRPDGGPESSGQASASPGAAAPGAAAAAGTAGDGVPPAALSAPAPPAAPAAPAAPTAAPGVDSAAVASKSARADGEMRDGAIFDAHKTDEAHPAAKPVIEVGSAHFINQDAAARGVPPKPAEGDVSFNFEGTPIQGVIKAILGEMLHENYVIAPGVGGDVTFATARPIRADQALSVLEMLISWSGAALVYRDGRYTVLPVAQAAPGNLSPRFGPLDSSKGYALRIVPLSYISATEMEKLLQPYAKPGAIVRADNARSMMILGGNAADLQTYLDTIEIFDVNWLAGMSVGIYPLERVEVKDVVPELEKIFGDGANTPLAGMFRFMPIERLNSVLVITPQPKYLEEAQKWLARLDRGGSESGAQLYVYYVKNVKATDLADNLNDIFGSGGSSAKPKKSSTIGSVAPNLRPVEISTVSGNNKQKEERPVNTPATPSGGDGISVASGDDIRITAIEESNALMIRATPGEYDSIQSAIKRLDTQPLQVLIEVKILSVDLNDSTSLGVQWAFEHSTLAPANLAYRNDVRGFNSDVGAPRGPNPWKSFAGNISGSGVGWTFLSKTAEAALSTLQSNGDAKMLSAPSLVVLNNKEASINVGTQLPVVSSYIGGITTGTTNGTNSGIAQQGQVQFRNTGITLEVTPRVNPGGLVYMEIKQEDSAPIGAPTAENPNVSLKQKQISTEIAVQSGHTVMLGGLISDSDGVNSSGVPGLSRIPIIGALFGSQGRVKTRQELLVLITPTVIGNPEEAQDITDEYRKRLHGMEPLMRKALAPQTPVVVPDGKQH